jgi:N-acetyl-1-D-myo-inositol-2-amino-2-deoxy-alpha-D-glucopyranoside deacetylase
VVTCTNGEEGEVLDPDLDPEEAKPRLGDLRLAELRAACEVLKVRELRLLGYRDSGMKDWPSTERLDAFCNADLDEAAGRLVRIIRELQPQVMITEQTENGYNHPDHVMGQRISMRAFELAGDPNALPEAGPPWRPARLYAIAHVRDRWDEVAKLVLEAGLEYEWLQRRQSNSRQGTPKEACTAAVDVSDYTEIQRQALACHRTQIARDSWWLTLPPHIRRVAFGTAYFVRLHPTPAPGEHETDLFEDLD